MRSNDRISASVFLLFSLFVCQQSIVIGVGTLRQPGPGLLAFGASIAMGGLSLYLLIQSFISKEKIQEGLEYLSALKAGKLLTVCISLFVYTIAVNHLGFVIATFLFVIFLLNLIESKKWWRILLEATLITAGNHLIFVTALGLNMPAGLFFR